MPALLNELEPQLVGCDCANALTTIAQALQARGLTSYVNMCVAKAGGLSEPESYFADIVPGQSTGSEQNSGIWRNTPMAADVFADLYLRRQADDKMGVQVGTGIMSLDEMAAFAKHLIEVYTAVHHFRTDLLPVVGGPVQLVCVDRQGRLVAK